MGLWESVDRPVLTRDGEEEKGMCRNEWESHPSWAAEMSCPYRLGSAVVRRGQEKNSC